MTHAYYESIAFWRTMLSAPVRHTLPTSYAVIFLVGHTTLTLLNLIWYGHCLFQPSALVLRDAFPTTGLAR